MSEDFYPFVDSGDPAPDNSHLTGESNPHPTAPTVDNPEATYTIRISVYDDMLSTPRVIVVEQRDVRTYLEDVTNTVYRTMKEQGGRLSLMIIRELVENFIHAQFTEPVISILDNGDTIRFADQGPGINDKERAFEFGVTSADRSKKRYIRGTGAGLPMVQQYVENAGGAISVEDNLGAGTVVTVTVDPARVAELERAVSRGAAVRSGHHAEVPPQQGAAGAQAQPPSYPAAPNPPYPVPAPYTAMQTGAGYPAAAMQPQPGAQQAPWGGPAEHNPAYPYGMNPHGYAEGVPYPGAPMGVQPGQAAQQAAWGQQQAGAWATVQQPGQPYGLGAWQQPVPPGAIGYSGNAANDAPAPAAADPYVSERGSLALRLIAQNGKGGPTDLTRAFGNSDATWSRELDALASTGLIYKRGQKYVLTDLGQAWSHNHQ